MLACANTATISGLESSTVRVEVDLSRGKPQLIIIGLATQAVSESKERITSALLNCGIIPKAKRTVVNLAPADIKKSGTGFDLAITIAMLKAYTVIGYDISHTLFFGELSLDGSIKKVRGIVPLLLHAKKIGCTKVVIPKDNEIEISIIEGITVYAISHLKDLLQIQKLSRLAPLKKKPIKISETSFQYTFEEIYGQHEAKRALEIAAAGGHNVLLTGPPGTGKSLLAKSIVSILPDLESEELLAVNSIYSISGLLDRNLISQRPFRTPHHTISSTAMIGGGKSLNPGEISLAHRGILFMDEFFEFPTNILESLRQPLEDGTITISRISGNSTYPCECMLIAASNPCPCGYRFSQMKTCSCTQNQYIAYKKKMSGPIIDRIDIRVFVQPVETKLLTTTSLQQNATSSDIRKKVGIARRIQVERYKDECILTNSQLTTRLISKFCNLTIEAEKLLKRSNQKYQLSTRSFFRIIKVAQTIADLSQKSEISVENIAEALQYRKLEL